MTGYRGRFCIVEVLTMSAEIERLIGAGSPADRIAEAARTNGMRPLWWSGLRHVLSGETAVDELLRVVDVPGEEASAAAAPPPPPPPAVRPPAPRGYAHASSAVADFGIGFERFDEPGPPASGVSALGAKILLVEDEDSLRRVMKDLLEREGYVISEARDGVQALDQVDRHAPDLIMLDLNLPGLDGYTVLEQLRSRPATAHIPVIVLTAKGDEDNEVRVFELGADDFLTKPFRARALSARLQAVLARRRP
jgi:CheY-like chemotaxis protein